MMRTSALIGVVVAAVSADDGVCAGADCNLQDESALLQRPNARDAAEIAATLPALPNCGPTLKRLKKMYETIGDRVEPGGLLIHMLGPDDLKPIFDRPVGSGGLPTFRDMADCSMNNRHTCSAWSWHRKDLATFAYNYPAAGIRMSVIVDGSKSWPLTTYSGPTDRDTNDRSACSNNNPVAFSNPWNSYGGDGLPECMRGRAVAAGITSADVVYQPTWDSGATAAKRNCDPDDQVCKAVTSGGCMNHQWMLGTDLCLLPADELHACFSFEPVDGPPPGATDFLVPTSGKYWGVYFSGACQACTQPYVCTFNSAAGGLVTPSYNSGERRYEQNVGVDAKEWARQYFSGLLDGSTTDSQCNFEQDKSIELVNAFHSWYEETINTKPYQLFGDPNNPVYLQSEVNMYVYGDTFTQEYRNQDDLFFDSVVSLGIDTRTCVEMLAFLDADVYNIDEAGSYFVNAQDRCNAFLGANYEAAEQESIKESRRLIRQLQARMTIKTGRAIAVVETHYAPNVATNLDSLQKALDGNNPFEETYKPYREW